MRTFRIMGVNASRLVGVCTDGGTEYTGKSSGVTVLLQKAHKSCIFAMHCVAHRVALAMKGTSFKALKCAAWSLEDVDLLLADVYTLFCKSPKRKKQWASFVRYNGLALKKIFPMYNATRWFSRRACLEVLVAALPWLILFLSQRGSRPNPSSRGPRRLKEKWPGVDGLLNRLRDVNLFALTMALHDLVALTDNFNQSVQRDGITSVEVANMARELAKSLRSCVSGGKPDVVEKVGDKRTRAESDKGESTSAPQPERSFECSAILKSLNNYLDCVSPITQGSKTGQYCWDARLGAIARKVVLHAGDELITSSLADAWEGAGPARQRLHVLEE
jgi:hypothetical protein